MVIILLQSKGGTGRIWTRLSPCTDEKSGKQKAGSADDGIALGVEECRPYRDILCKIASTQPSLPFVD